MASRGSTTSKIPKFSTPPASPRTGRRQPQATRTEGVKTKIPPVSPRQATRTISTPTGSKKSRMPVPEKRLQQANPTLQEPCNPTPARHFQPVIETKGKASSGNAVATGLTFPVSSGNGNENLSSYPDPLMHNDDSVSTSKESLKDDNTDNGNEISKEEVDSALIGLIMPTSDLRDYLQLTSISEEETSDNTDSPEVLLNEIQEPSTTTSDDDLRNLLLKTVDEAPRTATAPCSLLDKEPITSHPYSNDIFDTPVDLLDAEDREVIPSSVNLEVQAQEFFNDLMEQVGKKAAEFLLDFEEVTSVRTEHIHVSNDDSPLANVGLSTTMDTEKAGQRSPNSTLDSLDDASAVLYSQLDQDQDGEATTSATQVIPVLRTDEHLATADSSSIDWNETNLATQYSDESDDEELEVFQIQFPTDTETELDVEGEINGNVLVTEYTEENLNMANKKKPITIFSVDAPLSSGQIETGPGEIGDGRGVHSPQGKSKTDFTAEEHIPQLADETSEPVPYSHSGNFSSRSKQQISGDPFQELYIRKIGDDAILDTAERTVKTIVENWSNAATQNSSSNESMNTSEGNPFMGVLKKGACKALVAKNLILRRGSKEAFCQQIPIQNSTSSLYAFKVCCDNCPCINATPAIGLLPPESSTIVEIRAENAMQSKQLLGPNGKLEVKIFPANDVDDDPEKLDKSYKNLLSQCPRLIQTQTIDRIIVWDDGNLKKKLSFFHSIKDNEERKFLLENLHGLQALATEKSQANVINQCKSKSSMSFLASLKKQVKVTNSHVQEMISEIQFFRESQYTVLYTCMLILIALVAHSHLTYMSASSAPKSEPTWYEKMWNDLINLY